MTELTLPQYVVDVKTGEQLPATPENAARALNVARDMMGQLRDVRAGANSVLVEEARRQGKKTLRLGGYVVTVSDDKEIVWDLAILSKLLDEGLPQERWNELVTETVETKVSAQVAKEIAGANPKYASIVSQARSDFVKGQYASVKA